MRVAAERTEVAASGVLRLEARLAAMLLASETEEEAAMVTTIRSDAAITSTVTCVGATLAAAAMAAAIASFWACVTSSALPAARISTIAVWMVAVAAPGGASGTGGARG